MVVENREQQRDVGVESKINYYNILNSSHVHMCFVFVFFFLTFDQTCIDSGDIL